MNNKLTNKQLIIVLIALIGIYAIVRYINHKRGQNTFHTAIIPKIDTANITDMYIYLNSKKDQGKPLHFFKKGNIWMVSQNGYTTMADRHAEQYTIKQLQQINPDRLAANDPSQWKEFRVVDTMGTRVLLLNHEDTVVDLIVGKFGYNMQARQGISYVRLHGQKEVYGVTGFLAMNITEDADSWRDRKAIYMQDNMWNRISFNYPGDSSYSLVKDTANKWHFTDGGKPDSIAVNNILATMSRQNYGSFVYKFDTNSVKPLYTVQISGKGLNAVLIKAYPADTVNKFVVTSTMNPGAYFSGSKTGMFKSFFVARSALMHHKTAKRPAPPAHRHTAKKRK